MVMSILHRITGAALYFGTLLLAAWLVAAASGPDAFQTVSGYLNSWPGWIVLFGYTWALIHHGIGGIRHFIWDFGVGYDLATIDFLSWGTIIVSVLLTAVVWFVVISRLGGV
jgi:succinate dehydrogenase / fumarate reductase cytochrome b subunit